jgi:hypothetical protein
MSSSPMIAREPAAEMPATNDNASVGSGLTEICMRGVGTIAPFPANRFRPGVDPHPSWQRDMDDDYDDLLAIIGTEMAQPKA